MALVVAFCCGLYAKVSISSHDIRITEGDVMLRLLELKSVTKVKRGYRLEYYSNPLLSNAVKQMMKKFKETSNVHHH